MSEKIEIKLDGPRLTPDKFRQATGAFFDLLTGVANNIASGSKGDDWTVKVSGGSAIVSAESNAPYTALAIDAATRGLMSLASGVRAIPPHFTKDEVKAARQLARTIDDDGVFVTAVSVKNGGLPFALSLEIVKTADAILSGETQKAFGSIEGMIESLRHGDGMVFICTINDPVHGRSISCSFTNPTAEEVAYRAFRPPRRVLASGLIHYAKEGHPTRIDVDFVRVFPEEGELPSIEEVRAFFGK